jgi:hypothetical protein
VTRIGNTLFMRGNPAFYRRLGSIVSNVHQGTWLQAPANSAGLSALTGFTDLDQELGGLLANAGTVTKGATRTVDGQQAIELKQVGKLSTVALYIATTGKPYPIERVKLGGKAAKTTFSGWDRPVDLNAPSNAIKIR